MDIVPNKFLNDFKSLWMSYIYSVYMRDGEYFDIYSIIFYHSVSEKSESIYICVTAYAGK